MRGAQSVLRLSLATFSEQLSFAELRPGKLRLYLKGQAQYINPLYQMLLNDCLSVVLARTDDDTRSITLGSDAIRPVGFAADEGLLPYPPASFTGYRLLTEFFIFPEKFMFVDLEGLWEELGRSGLDDLGRFSLRLNLDTDEAAGLAITRRHVRMGCTPVVNLFDHSGDPVLRNPRNHAIDFVKRVVGLPGDRVEMRDSPAPSAPGYWHQPDSTRDTPCCA